MPSINDFFQMEGLTFSIERNNTLVFDITGVDQYEDHFVSFLPTSDIKTGDILIHPSGKKYSVLNTSFEYFGKEPYALNAYY